MQRRNFLFGAAALGAALPLASCGARGTVPAGTTPGAPFGRLFAAQLDAVAGAYPDVATLALLRSIANQKSPTAPQLETALSLLGNYGAMSDVPQPIPPGAPLQFPADHAWHPDMSIEWYYFTMSLPLVGGGVVSVICNFFRKSLAPAGLVLGISDLGRQIFSTSIATTIELPDEPAVHYAWPVQSFFGTDPAVQIESSPLKTVLGLQSIVGTNDVFPAHYHLDNAVPPDGPHVVIDIDAAASHPLFLQGVNGYDGTPSGTAQTVGYYYYSWPQQAATGTVTIDGITYETTGGVVWMDHQFGGNVPVRSGPPGAWTGWSWFEFQFGGGISLTLTNTHGPIVNGIDDPAPGFGTLIMPDGTSELVGNTLSIGGYTPSIATTARYPSSWTIDVTEGLIYPVSLHVVPVTDVAQQAMWMGAQVEYAEASSTVTATGSINGVDVGTLTGVGYCESVGFEDTTLLAARQIQYLNDTLVR